MKSHQRIADTMGQTQKRKEIRRDDLLRVAGAMGIPRERLANPDRWTELARGSMSYEPDRALVAMVRDVCRTARLKSTLPQQQAVRRAVTLYCCKTLLNEMLEPLGLTPVSEPVVQLFQEATKEQAEADCAAAIALQAPTPTNDEKAAREFEEAAIVDEELARGLRARCRQAWERATQ
jgi:hypothetical protein